MTTLMDEVLVRALDVTVRRGEDDGLLVETLIGRYMFDTQARDVWRQLDGRRSVREVVERVAEVTAKPVDEVRAPVEAFVGQLLDLRLLERA
ncbi:PqqD family protein [Streptomyces sp. XD-27]|uniref:PqqD family protein n=1 Tax=Streptomyces sp. XD-27 TaxID=3062779 RepID=UPI0026F43331|nr:PqqD family protein [Streptomyces sp. XD-27]WKX73981.1 PqqD family protein [Streptomyces sp. XD-27]